MLDCSSTVAGQAELMFHQIRGTDLIDHRAVSGGESFVEHAPDHRSRVCCVGVGWVRRDAHVSSSARVVAAWMQSVQ